MKILFQGCLQRSFDCVNMHKSRTGDPFRIFLWQFSQRHIREFWLRQHHILRIRLDKWGKIIVLHVRHALTIPCGAAKQQREITTFAVLMTTWACNRISLILCTWFNDTHTSPVVANYANIVECYQDGIIAQIVTLRQWRIFKWRFPWLCCHHC